MLIVAAVTYDRVLSYELLHYSTIRPTHVVRLELQLSVNCQYCRQCVRLVLLIKRTNLDIVHNVLR